MNKINYFNFDYGLRLKKAPGIKYLTTSKYCRLEEGDVSLFIWLEKWKDEEGLKNFIE